MGCIQDCNLRFLVLGVTLFLVQYTTINAQNVPIKKHYHHPVETAPPSFARQAKSDDYDETYYKDVSDIAGLQSTVSNSTNNYRNDDDEDATNSDYLEELGSATDDVFQTLNADPYFEIALTTSKVDYPTTEIYHVEPEVPEAPITFFSGVPNYSNDTLPKCPEGYNTYQNENGIAICFVEKEASTYPPACPYSNYLDAHLLPNEIISNNHIWAKPPTTMFDGFGANFVTTTWNYNTSPKSCAVFHRSETLSMTACSNKFQSVCAYNYENNQYTFDDYCKKRFNESCVAADLGSGNKCYCVVESHINGQSRNNFCNKLAEPLEPYQNILLLKQLTPNNRCWIGFHQSNGIFKWDSSKASTNYTYWSFITDFANSLGAIGHEAWSLEKEGTLDCAVCEVETEGHPSVYLKIKHNKNTNKIVLSVENAIEAFGGVYCYSYATEYYVDLNTNDKNYVEVDVFDVNDIPRYYWCKTYQIPDLTPIYSNKILAQTKIPNNGHEYVIQNKSEIPSSPYFMTQVIFNETNNILYHLHTVPSNYSVQEETDFLEELTSTEIKSSEACLPSTTISNNITLNWPETVIGATVLPETPCLQSNGFPVTRKCLGNFLYGATWSSVKGPCWNMTEINATQLYQKIRSRSDPSTKENVGLLEAHMIIKHLIGLTNFTEFFEALDNLLDYPATSLKQAQVTLNSSDALKDSFDKHLLEADVSNSLQNVTFSNFIVHSINISNSNAIGFKLNVNDTFTKIFYRDTDISEDFDLVIKTSEQLYEEIVKCSIDPPKLIVVLFKKDSLFGDSQSSSISRANIIKLIIPGIDRCDIPSKAEVLFRFPKDSTSYHLKCASWNYGSNDLMENIYGHWLITNSPNEQTNSYRSCEVQQGAYYTLLEEVGAVFADNGRTVPLVLGILVSIISVISLIGVITTVIAFEIHSYKHLAVINLSFSAAVQLILVFAVMSSKISGLGCVIIAAAVHYTTLAQFLWMLIIAWLQHNYYLRTKTKKEKYVLQACLVAWGAPLLLVVIMLSSSSFNYGKNALDICCATSDNFIYALLLPVCLALLITLTIFGKIGASLKFSKKIKAYHFANETSFLQLKLALILCLLLGITWGLGILTTVLVTKAVIYVYFFIACLQEIVVFAFLIVLSEKTRPLWVSVKTACFLSKSKGYELTPTRKGWKRFKPKYSISSF